MCLALCWASLLWALKLLLSTPTVGMPIQGLRVPCQQTPLHPFDARGFRGPVSYQLVGVDSPFDHSGSVEMLPALDEPVDGDQLGHKVLYL